MLFLLLVALPLLARLGQVTGAPSFEQRLYRELLVTSDYQPHVRPRLNGNQTVDVTLNLELLRIASIDERKETVTLYGFIQAMWYDDFLRWTPAQYGGVTQLVVPPSTVWLPDFGIENSANSFYQTTFTTDFRVRVQSDGKITWDFGGRLETTCSMDMTHYPFDEQECAIVIENWAYTGHEVKLWNGSAHINAGQFMNNPVWTLADTTAHHEDHYYDVSGDVPFSEVLFTMYLQRKSAYYVLNLMGPNLFLIVVALGSFWLPADSGEKVSLSVTVLLAFSVFQLVIAEKIPENSDHTPVLSKFVATMMGVSAASVLTSILNIYISGRGSLTTMPTWLRTLVFSAPVRWLCTANTVPEVGRHVDRATDLTPDPAEAVLDGSPAKSWAEAPQNGGLGEVLGSARLEESSDSGRLGEVLRFLRELRRRERERQTGERAVAEWRAVAVAVDRLLFWVCSIVVITSTTAFMVIANTTHIHTE